MSTVTNQAHFRARLSEILWWNPTGEDMAILLRRLCWILDLKRMGVYSNDSIALSMIRLNMRGHLLELLPYLAFRTWQAYRELRNDPILLREYLSYFLGVSTDSPQVDNMILLLDEFVYLDEFGFDDFGFLAKASPPKD